MNSSQVKQQQQKKMKKTSAKKGPVKGLRNVLARPFDTQWPVLDKDAECRLEELLTRLLPELRHSAPFVPWSQLRKLDKDERRAAREKLRQDSKDIKNGDNDVRKSVTLGVNAVTRDLEKEKLDSVLLDSGVEALLIEHVVSMARNGGIPILMVPFLKKVTLEGVGFASAAMGLKREVADSAHVFHEVHREIIKLARIVAPPETAVSPREVSHPRIEAVESCVREEISSETRFALSTSVYEYRSTRNERIFVPPNSVEKTSDGREEWGDDFIAVGKDDDVKLTAPKYLVPRGRKRLADERAAPKEKETRRSNESVSLDNDLPEVKKKKKRRKDNATYLPLKVKRMQGNNNRVKAKKSIKPKKKMLLNKKS